MKALLALTAVLSFGAAAAQETSTTTAAQAPVLNDVPAGHWAKDAVDRLVQEGVILGFPDGTYRGTQNLTRYQAAVIIARVLDKIAQGGTEGISDETLTSLQNAVQELAADLAALGVRVSDLEENAATKEDIARIEERLESLTVPGGDDGATDELRGQLDELTARVDELASNFDTLRADVDDNASSIAALNDLTVLLNQDILSLQDRVSAIEAGYVDRTDFDNLSNRVTGVEGRVGNLEAGRVSVSGFNFGIVYGNTYQISGANFDVDRVDNTILGDNNVNNADAGTNPVNSSFPGFNLTVSNLNAAGGGFTVNQATFGIGFTNVFSAPGAGNVALVLNGATVTGSFAGNPFNLTYSANGSSFKLNDYLGVNTDGSGRRGVVATLTGSELPLNPSLTIATGTGNVGQAADTGYFGIRAAINPFSLGTVGVNYITAAGYRVAFGVDYNLTPIAGARLTGVYNASIANGSSFDAREQALDNTLTFGVGPVNLTGRVVATSTGYNNAAAVTELQSSLPTAPNAFGYRVAADTTLGPVAFSANYAYSNNYTNTGAAVNSFGVTAGIANFFSGFGVSASYSNVTLGGAQRTSQAHTVSAFGTPTTSFGVTLTHNGAAANALVRGLDLNVGYTNSYDDTPAVSAFGLTTVSASAAYNTTVSGITLRPFVRYSTTDAAAASTRTDNNTFKYGVSVSAPLAGVALSPTISGGVAGRTTTTTAANAGAAQAPVSELLAYGELGLGQLFSTNSTFAIGTAYYSGTNVASMNVGTTNNNFPGNAFNATNNNIYSDAGAATGTLLGIYAKATYFGFQAAYGTYTLNTAGTTSAIQGFRVGYDVRF